MVISLKDSFKLLGIFIMSCCAVTVCALFLNYNMDLAELEPQISDGMVRVFYDAQVMTGKVVIAVCGGCLLVTTVILLFFYIRNYIDTHKKELGILKALGYSNFKIAGSFWVFGLSVLIGTVAGYGIAITLMPGFYRVQNKEKILPEFSMHFHPLPALCLTVLPAALFALLSVLYSYRKLGMPVLELLREKTAVKVRKKKEGKKAKKELPFLRELQRSTLGASPALVFFIGFAAFCYSSMMQMSSSMDELASAFMAAMMIIIGIVLACTSLFLAITSVVNGNKKTIAMLRVFGYSEKACSSSILGGYRPVAYIGFVIGTIYQYMLLKIMVTVVFADVDMVPEYNFDFKAFGIVLVSFAILYELVMWRYTEKLKKVSIKEVMLES
ncbi:MAG: FtsX-like permease family protein [Lachnospiraceae bacterium]|nr:FtsX-like permease family protein [Lachnospiraceae bacterium]